MNKQILTISIILLLISLIPGIFLYIKLTNKTPEDIPVIGSRFTRGNPLAKKEVLPSPINIPSETPITNDNYYNSPTQTPVPTPFPTFATIEAQPEIVWGNRNKKQVIFTFDAGAGTQSVTKILEVLKKYNIKATFFLTGKWAEENPEFVKLISQSRHEIFNHTYSHPHLTQVSDGTIIDEFRKTDELIQSLTGKSTKPYFRPPFGERNSYVLDLAATQGYRSVYWTVDALDWKESEGYTQDQVKERIFSNLNPGTMFLMHVGDNITGNILEEVILRLRSQGYTIVSLTEGIN